MLEVRGYDKQYKLKVNSIPNKKVRCTPIKIGNKIGLPSHLKTIVFGFGFNIALHILANEIAEDHMLRL